MEINPGTYINIFTDLIVQYSGLLESVTFFPEKAGDVYISFWNNTATNKFTLLLKVSVNAQAEKQVTTVQLSQQNLYVIMGSTVGIHYPQSAKGVIDFSEDATNHKLYNAVNANVQDGGWPNGHVVTGTDYKNRTASLHLNICALCENSTYDFDCTPCSPNCAGDQSCDSYNGTCDFGCEDGYNGSKCDEACDEGFYGRECSFNCSLNCVNSTTCQVETGHCTNGCEAGYQQPLCDKECPLNFFGEKCNNSCGECLHGEPCHHVDGTCLLGCQDGYQYTPQCTEECFPGTYGRNCSFDCSGNCYLNETCSRINGTCESCDAGYDFTKSSRCDTQCPLYFFGEKCNNSCGECLHGEPCHHVDGTCLLGCQDGYQYTPQCTEECFPGTYGRNCSFDCSGNCYLNETCSRINGTCESCDAGYDFTKSSRCDTPCVSSSFGPNCQYNCHCKDSAPCDAVSGYCSNHACEPGWQGWNCSVSQGVEPSDPSTSSILAWGIVILLLLVASMIVNGIFLYKRLGSERDKHEETHDFVNINDIAAGEVNDGVVDDERQRGREKKVDVSTPSDRYMTPHETTASTVSPPETDTYSKSIHVDDFHNTLVQYTSATFRAEFMKLNKSQLRSWTFAKQDVLKNKNMYKNIIPYDDNRVDLYSESGAPCDSYINASYVKGYGSSRTTYIASQGPQNATVDDFFRMLWQENVHVVVMLTNTIENNKAKCVKYWPDKGIITVAGMQMQLIKETRSHDIVERHFKLSKGTRQRSLRQWQYIAWPDHGAPRTFTACFDIWHRIKDFHQHISYTPILVHCSAGVGRTGTFLALEYLREQALCTKYIDVPKCVNTLRTFRFNMVQTVEQYEFVYRALNQHLKLGMDTVFAHTICLSVLQDILDTNGKDRLEKHFRFLEDTKPVIDKTEIQIGMSKENKSKTRDLSVMPADVHCLFSEDDNGIGMEYINAVLIKDHMDKQEYVATQIPLMNTVKDFWRLLFEMNIQTVVCLNEAAPEGHQWIPTSSVSLQIEGITVKRATTHAAVTGSSVQTMDVVVESERAADTVKDASQYTNISDVEKCQYANTANVVSSVSRTQARILFGQCTEVCDVTDKELNALHNLIREVRRHLSPGQPLAVVCINGAANSGLFIACDILAQMISSQDTVDVCNVVQVIREKRPQFIVNLGQYIFLHHFADYLLRCK